MPAFKTRHRVAHTPRQMFDLVADIERYPEFLPMCSGLTILSRQPAAADGERLVARMTVGYKTISEAFTTRVLVQPEPLAISANYVDGPFKFLDNEWQFLATDDGGCEIAFDIRYEFKSMILGALVGGVFDQAFRKFTQAFEARAHTVYGPPTGRSAGSV